MFKKILGQVLGNKKGLLSLISEKTGKISFKRVGGIMVISYIINKVDPNELTAIHVVLIIASLLSVALPKITDFFKK